MSSTDKPYDVLNHFRRVRFQPGEIARVRQLLDDRGKAMILPYDQFVEHDSRHLEAESDAGNPDYIMDLARTGKYTGAAVHYGLAARFWTKLEGAIPLIVKINGKTGVPPADAPFSAHTSFVDDAVRLGAIAVGYTLYYGSPRQDEDMAQLAAVRKECERCGFPLIIWAYPRGRDIVAKGGIDTSYAIESATRLAVEMGATIVKANIPAAAGDVFFENPSVPVYYKRLEEELGTLSEGDSLQIRCDRVVRAGQGVPVLFSGGSTISDEDLLYRAEVCV